MPPPKKADPEKTRKRRSSKVGARFTGTAGKQGFGPQALHLNFKGKDVNLRTTRSIGDWDGARVAVPFPEVFHFDVQPDQAMRIVMASDGLWDELTPAKVCKTVYEIGGSQSAHDVATLLTRDAYDLHRAIYNKLKDDLTVMVVDIGDAKSTSSHCRHPHRPLRFLPLHRLVSTPPTVGGALISYSVPLPTVRVLEMFNCWFYSLSKNLSALCTLLGPDAPRIHGYADAPDRPGCCSQSCVMHCVCECEMPDRCRALQLRIPAASRL